MFLLSSSLFVSVVVATTTSSNFFDLKPSCEKLGARYCDYGKHNLGSGDEFANWKERTQHVYTNMARMDSAAFAEAPYKIRIK